MFDIIKWQYVITNPDHNLTKELLSFLNVTRLTDDPDFDAEEELKQASEAMDEGIQVTPAPVVKKEHVDTSAIEPIVSAPVTATTSTKK